MDVCVLDIEALLPGLAERSAELKAMTMEAERARNEEGEVARRREQEAARQRSEAADLARLEALRSDNRQVLVSHQYARLADIVESRSADCQSDVGRAAFQVVVERYRKLAWLRSYIIDKMRAKPLRWGWGTGRESVDVLGADERGIRITGKKIPWSKVGPAQLAKWAVLYSKEARLPRHTAGSLQLALAVLYDEHGAVEKAEKARTLAITTWARLGEEADRLLSPQ